MHPNKNIILNSILSDQKTGLFFDKLRQHRYLTSLKLFSFFSNKNKQFHSVGDKIVIHYSNNEPEFNIVYQKLFYLYFFCHVMGIYVVQ